MRNNVSLGKAIYRIRKSLGLSQKDTANLCGISQTSMSQIESGYKSPKPETLRRFCDGIRVPVMAVYFIAGDYAWSPEQMPRKYNIIFPLLKRMLMEELMDDVPWLTDVQEAKQKPQLSMC